MKKSKRIIYIALILLLLCLCVIGCSSKSKNENTTYKMLLLGDSISEGAGASDISLKWYTFLSPYFEENYGISFDSNNVSMGGSSSYAGYSNLMKLDAKDDYDIIIICYGENDSVKDFELYYESILYNISLKYPEATVFAILESSQREYTDKMQAVQRLCDAYNIRTIDIIKAFAESGRPYEELSDDGIHPNDNGQQVYYETVKNVLQEYIKLEGGIKDKYILNRGTISAENKPIDNRLIDWGEYTFISVDECKEVGEDTYKISSNEIKAGKYLVGIDFDCIDGQNTVSISNGKGVVLDRNQNWNYGFAQKHIEVMGEAMLDGQDLTISFATKEQKEHFYGLCVTSLN